MGLDTPELSPAGLRSYQALREAAIASVAERFETTHGSTYAAFGPRGREACREDLAFHLEFLRPVLEFGLVQPMVDYLRWLSSVLSARDVPAEHLSQSLDWLAEFFGARMETPDGQVVVAALRHVGSEFRTPQEGVSGIYEKLPTAWPECDAFESALLTGDRRGAGALLDACLGLGMGRDLIDAELHLIQPALYSIGRRWQENQVSVAQEHLATAISQSLMSHGLLRSELPAPNGRSVLLACVEGNTHSVGLQMVSDAFQLAGWDVQYLGPNVPTASLLRQVQEFRPNLVGLSASFAQQLRVARDFMSRLTEALGAARPAVIIGGLAINQFDRLAGALGTDAFGSDARSAVVSGSRVLTTMGSG